MERRQHKSLPDGKIGIGLLITNRVYVSKKHNSADVVTICMLLLKQDMSAIGRWCYGFESRTGLAR
jgi:hypothetical protein